MKVPATSHTKYLLPILFFVTVVLLILPGKAFIGEPAAAKRSAAPAPAAPQTPNAGTIGQWNSTLIPFATVPVHISLLPNGKILYWGRDKETINNQLQDVSGGSNAYVVDPQFFFNNPVANTATHRNTSTNL